MSKNFAKDINDQAAADCQALKSVRMDLDGFLATHGDERARRWRGLDLTSKQDLVIQMLGRYEVSWTEAVVAEWIAKYDAKWGGELMDSEAATVAALERMAIENGQLAKQLRAARDADAGTFQRAATAYTNALIQYRAGVRPEVLPSGNLLLPSRRATEAPHILHRDGDWVCSCKAGASMHWPIALAVGIELAAEVLDRDDAGDVEIEPTPAELGRRLSAARCALYSRAA